MERLLGCSIIREGQTYAGFRSHADLRREMGDKNPYNSNPYDDEGFYTNKREFVSRTEAQLVALASGQLSSAMQRRMLSSDINWDYSPAKKSVSK